MNQEILRAIQSNPEAMQSMTMAVQELMQDPDITPDNIDEVIRMFEFVLQNPDTYAEFRMSAIQSGAMDEEDLPPEFDAGLLTIGLMALKVVKQQMEEGNMPQFARGGLNQIARMGRYGDTELAHITPFEARILQAYGGSGTINPYTGQPEFFLKKVFKAVKKVVKAIAPVLPVVLSFVAPGIGTAIGTALGATGTAASMLGSAAIGGLSSAASGGDFLKGAVGGALGAGVAPAIGGYVGDTLGVALGDTAKNVIGSSLVGGAQSALSGGDFLTGAVQGGTGGYLGSKLSGAASNVPGALGSGLQTAGQQFGNSLVMGATPEQALTQSAIAGLTAGMTYKDPSQAAVDSLKSGVNENTQVWDPEQQQYRFVNQSEIPGAPTQPMPMTTENKVWDPDLGAMRNVEAYEIGPNQAVNTVPSPLTAVQQASTTQPAAQAPAATKGFGIGDALSMLPLLSMFSSAQTPEEVQQIVSTMTPEQQEYFNRPMRTWNWDTLNAAAKIQGLPIGSYIARNWDKVGGGMYDNPVEPTPAMARGGVLNRLARGGGTGRSDSILAKLSDGEYVMDAETVALLGDGSTSAGAGKLDEMRAKIRQHKGKSMAKGKFSSDAKSPLSYLKASA
jgi:hypothetical protein